MYLIKHTLKSMMLPGNKIYSLKRTANNFYYQFPGEQLISPKNIKFGYKKIKIMSCIKLYH